MMQNTDLLRDEKYSDLYAGLFDAVFAIVIQSKENSARTFRSSFYIFQSVLIEDGLSEQEAEALLTRLCSEWHGSA